MKKTLVLILLCCAVTVGAKVKLPAVVGDNMMLQQQSEVKLWGTAAPKAEIKVTPGWSDEAVSCKADKQGRWELTVATPEASFETYDIIFDDGEQVVVKNVMIGEVWFAGGQSNMEMPLCGFGGCCIEGGLDEAIAAAQMPGIRFFNVPLRKSYQPQEDCEGRWMTTEKFSDVLNFSAVAWYFASNLSRALHVPVGIVSCAHGGSKVESWLPKDILEDYPDMPTDSTAIAAVEPHYERPMLMYNGMFLPVKDFTVKGIIWYQGCSNVGHHEDYVERLATMVQRWREDMVGDGAIGVKTEDIPFYYVEIAPYSYDEPAQHGLAAFLREAQFKAQEVIPNSAMISTNDLVEPYERHNIHPRQKTAVGHRLSYLALNLTYGFKEVTCFGPEYKSMTVKDNEAWVAFKNLDRGICRNYDLRGFEVAGEDKVFYPADNVWLHWQTNEVVISSENVPVPVAVRYCFRDFQIGTMIGGNELPTVPFRTDDWDGPTDTEATE